MYPLFYPQTFPAPAYGGFYREEEEVLAVTHADELGYMLRITTPATFPKQTMLDRNSASSRTLSTMSRLWTNFAKVGNPGLHGWVAASSAGDAQSAPYAKLSDATMGSLGKGLGGAAMPLFEDLFALTRVKKNSG